MYIELAPDVPARTNSPYFALAVLRVQDASIKLKQWASSTGERDPALLEEKAAALLAEAQEAVMRHLSRNVFLMGGEGAE